MKPDPTGAATAAVSLETQREQLRSCLEELFQIDTMVCESLPASYENLPNGRHWEYTDQFEAITERLDASIGFTETWLNCKAWRDKTELAPVLKSIRRAGRVALEVAGEFDQDGGGDLTRLAEILRALAKVHRQASDFGLAYADRLAMGSSAPVPDDLPSMPAFRSEEFARLLATEPG